MELSVSLNVGGKRFMTTKETLETYPDTLLGNLVKKNQRESGKMLELAFDRNPEIVNNVLDFYRTGEIHLPSNMCPVVAERELKFWRIPVEMIPWCCWKKFENEKYDAAIAKEIARSLDEPLREEAEKEETKSLRTKIWLTMEFTNYSRLARVWNVFYYSVVLMSVLNLVLKSTSPFREVNPRYSATYEVLSSEKPANISVAHADICQPWYRLLMTQPVPWMMNLEICINCFFAVECFIRFVVCPKKSAFFKDFKNCLDVFLLVHFVLFWIVEEGWVAQKKSFSQEELQMFLVFMSLSLLRALRLMHFAKDFSAIKVLWLSTKASWKDLVLLVICVTTFVTLFGAVIHLTEMADKSNTFPSIPAAMWWALVTMTTVGYGDVVPVSTAGQLVGSVCALCGVIVLALPVAVLGSRFTDYHGNMSSRQQMRKTLTFLKDNPQFRKKDGVVVTDFYNDDDDDNKDDDQEVKLEERSEDCKQIKEKSEGDEMVDGNDRSGNGLGGQYKNCHQWFGYQYSTSVSGAKAKVYPKY